MASNTQKMNMIKKLLGNLDAFKERIKAFINARERIDLATLQKKVQDLQGVIEPPMNECPRAHKRGQYKL